ncbi:MAG: ATP-binding protein [archaeon]|nr:ATP-binding protein [archaeon]
MDREIVRTSYLERISAGRGDTGIVKVITGMRRVGKSVLMQQYIDDLTGSGVSRDDILFIDFESLEGQDIRDKDDLNKILKEKVPEDRLFFVFFDEIQNVQGWEMSVSALNHMKNVDVYITGSNSDMLSSDLATHISGRHVEIEVFPLSLKEFIGLHGYGDRETAFHEYLHYGGLPAIDPSRGWRYARDYLQGVYNTVVVKDVLKNIGTANASKIEAVSRFLFSNIGNTTNVSSISKATGFSTNTVDSYIGTMTDAFLFSMCQRYDMVGKRLLNTNGKYYATDLGLRNAALGITAGSDISRPLENLVYIELCRRGYDVRVGSYHDEEVDFLAMRSDSMEYFQVCQTLMSEGTRRRETRSLERPRDNHPKTVLTLDRYGLGDENGIKIVNVIDWLMADGQSP